MLEMIDGTVVEAHKLTGGVANTVWLVTLADGGQQVVKATEGAPPGMFPAEAAGLRALREGGVRTPDVLAVADGHLVLEALRPCPDEPEFWARAGRATARLHGNAGERFGWPADGWLGLLPQHNPWTDDGHRFFAEHRLLRYLGEPKAEGVLTAEDRAVVERICAKLPELVPVMPPVLTHGDLWRNNLVSTAAGEPAFIDPAVSWTWAEVDLAMLYCTPHRPHRFFDAYQEVRPLRPGWLERMPLLYLRELLCTFAHEGANRLCLDRFHEIVRPFVRSGRQPKED